MLKFKMGVQINTTSFCSTSAGPRVLLALFDGEFVTDILQTFWHFQPENDEPFIAIIGNCQSIFAWEKNDQSINSTN